MSVILHVLALLFFGPVAAGVHIKAVGSASAPRNVVDGEDADVEDSQGRQEIPTLQEYLAAGRARAEDGAALPEVVGARSLPSRTAPSPLALDTRRSLGCGETHVVDAESDREATCPQDCPYFVQNQLDARHCTFVCVPAEQCTKFHPGTPIADPKLGICRSPMVQACDEYVMDASTPDRCAVCSPGYRLAEDGQCYYKFKYLVFVLTCIGTLVAVLLTAWLVDMALRPASNEDQLHDALDFTRRKLLHKQEDVPAEVARGDSSITFSRRLGLQGTSGHLMRIGKLWPLSTNLCKQDVGGSGLVLHFNFQVAVMVWALLVAGVWALLGFTIDSDLFVLGTKPFGTPRENCILVAWGWETQERLMPVKCVFIWVAYIGSFALALVHSVRQLRLFQRLDDTNKTMKDYVAICNGLPSCSGRRPLEDELKRVLTQATGQRVVGVSVAWAYKDDEDAVMGALYKQLRQREGKHRRQLPPCPHEASYGPLRKKLHELESKYLCPLQEEADDADVRKMLANMSSSENAFVVFQTERQRNEAIRRVEQMGGILFEERQVHLYMPQCEPATVKWVNFGDHAAPHRKVLRLLQGCGLILVCLLLWTVFFYAPYAWSMFSFNYDNGQEPGFIYGLSFSMVVCIGNVMMYAACDAVAEHVGFRFSDDKEAAYLVFYTFSCLFNVVVDMVTTYFIAWTIMSELGFRAYDGTPLQDIPVFPQGFETYAIQRSLAENVKAYAFPSTFLIPFMIEPFATIWIPWILGRLLVRCHQEIRGRDAEEWLTAMPMDLSRYGDILLNMMIAILIFYFPGGYTIFLFVSMAACHAFIYVLDQWRLLRIVPSCTFASMQVDWWCQVMLAPCVAIMLSCLVFKSGNQEGFEDLGIWGNFAACTGAFTLHCVVHILLLLYVVPLFGEKDEVDDESRDATSDYQYQTLSHQTASSFFSTNPVHCLRSSHYYRHQPPCQYLVAGKEHLLEKNPKIGLWYDVPDVPKEEL
eukprot:TRINITY_DN4043_c0_g1_i1.p1 TRINITY_DN4043_c0_g1~~TRINITY_DN4043_c0_g1_i1.p1  ORF type:complete len:1037 (-),score=155.52 TRINITY_DN4043_c0_g1_i1:126-3074(-)